MRTGANRKGRAPRSVDGRRRVATPQRDLDGCAARVSLAPRSGARHTAHGMSTVSNKPSMHTGPAAAAATLPAPLGRALQESGLVKPGQTPADAAKILLGSLKDAGFSAPPTASKDVGVQLAATLRAFQQAKGLPVTGTVDRATADALKALGSPAAGPATETARTDKTRDGFERGGPTLLKQGEKQRADLVKNTSPDTNFLDALLQKLGGEHGVTADHAGHVGGKTETATNAAKSDAAKDVKRAKDADQKTGSTSDAQRTQREESAQMLDRAKESKVQVARGLRADQARTEELRRRAALFGKDPTERGLLDDEADEDDDAGDGGEGRRRGRGGQEQAGAHGEGQDEAGASGPKDGHERSRGNASSGGADDGDPARGVAVIDDGSGDAGGHHRIPSLSEQAFAALSLLKKDPQDGLRATTYSWDVVFYRPGVYAAGQKAEELVHLVVTSATAFDPVWQKAQANLQLLVRKLERDAPVPSFDDLVAALRQARARDGDAGAPRLSRVHRPPGRA